MATGLLVGGYTTAATADLGTALARTCRIWLVSMPVSAAQVGAGGKEGRDSGGSRGSATHNCTGVALQDRVAESLTCSTHPPLMQLVLVTALEGRSLVGTEDWADALPLAASGVGEPFVTAAGVLGAPRGPGEGGRTGGP